MLVVGVVAALWELDEHPAHRVAAAAKSSTGGVMDTAVTVNSRGYTIRPA
jgi:hypothetical protein